MSQMSEDNKEQKTEEKKSPDPSILFIKQVATALNRAKSENKILMVLIEKEEITSLNTWNNEEIINNIKQYTICLLIHDNTLAYKQFTVLYPIIDFPTIYCINPQNGQVLTCKYKQQITIDCVIQSIQTSYKSMIEQQKQPNQSINVTPNKKKNPALTKLEKIRQKAKTQKVKKIETNNNIKTENKNEINIKNKNDKQTVKKSKVKVSSLNNYNFNDNKLDVLESIEITRKYKNKLRKRNKKININKKVNNKRNNKLNLDSKLLRDTSDDIYSNTPILSAVNDNKLAEKIELNNNNKEARLLFIVNNGVNIEKYFNYNCKLIEIMNFIITETGINDFIFISQYPPINIDSIYLNQKMSQEIGLFNNILNNNQNSDEKSNESMYDKMQNMLQKTLYELNLVPSCRVFIKPKFEAYKRNNNNNNNSNDNIIMRFLYFIIDLIKGLIGYGYDGIILIFTLIINIINIPLKMIGIGKDNNNNNNNKNNNGEIRNNNKRKTSSKLPPLKKNKRLQGKKSGMMRLRHAEDQDDQNKYANGNSTMYGGDK